MDQNGRFIIVLLLLILIIVLPNGSPYAYLPTKDALSSQRHNLAALRNSTFGHPGNYTGFPSNSPTPEPIVHERWAALKQRLWPQSFAPTVWWNATGTLSGTWELVDQVKLNATANQTDVRINGELERNITALGSGLVTLNIEEAAEEDGKRGDGVGEVQLLMRMKDSDGGRSFYVQMEGAHFFDSGEMLGVTTSDGFPGLFALPHFTADKKQFNASKVLLSEFLDKVIKQQEAKDISHPPWVSSADALNEPDRPRCEYIAYLQLHPVQPRLLYQPNDEHMPHELHHHMSSRVMRKIEQELRFPTGTSLPSVPPLVASAVIYSPNCGFLAEAKELKGEKVERFYRRTANMGLGSAGIVAMQIWLIIRQMNDSSMPSTVSRISTWTLVMIGIVDGYFFLVFMLVALYLDACFHALIAASIAHIFLLSAFEMRFLVNAYKVQRPERGVRNAGAPTTPPLGHPEDGLPMPVTATPQVANAGTNSGDEVRSEINSLYMRFYFALVVILFVTLHAASWSPFYRDIFLQAILLASNSYWLPQIHRNIKRGCRKPFRWEFVFGMSICRLAPTVYIYLCPNNIFRVDPKPIAVAVICGWVWLQCCVLVSHELFGPRFLIPKKWLPPVYDYYAPPPEDEEAAEALLGTEVDGRRVFDCAICMQPVEVPRGRSLEGAGVGLLGRRQYMVTPCRHVFHTECLEGWMRYKLQCPVDRNPLPPL